MSISNALNNASSGLRANSKLVDTISNNVANELTPGYARRATDLSSATVNGYGSGVTTLATRRVEDVLLTTERRLGDATAAASTVRADAYAAILASFGEPGEAGSLSSRVTELETALLAAAASPQSQALLQDVLTAASSLSDGMNRVAKDNMQARAEADAEIASQVRALNQGLHQVDELNRKIVALNAQGIDTLGLQDQRASIIDTISSIVPMRAVNRDGGAVALYTQNGGVLLDGQVFELGFEATGDVITADMTIANGGVSALTQDQNAMGGFVTIDTAAANGQMSGGSLSALFAVRDSIVPGFDAELDRLASELIARFDGVQTAGTNDGLLVDSDPAAASATVGIAGRIRVNPSVDPAEGGALAALRSGIAGTESTDTGYGTHLQSLADALTASRTPAGWSSQVASADAATMAANIASFFATFSTNAESDRAYLTARQATLQEQETNRTGVDSDTELQTLMVVQQAYAANAKIISVIDELMQLLLEA